MLHNTIRPGLLICVLGKLYYRMQLLLSVAKEVLAAGRRAHIIDVGFSLDRRMVSSVFRGEEYLLRKLVIIRPKAYVEAIAAIYLSSRLLCSGDLLACSGISRVYHQLVTEESDRLLPLRFLSAACASLWISAHKRGTISLIEVESARIESGALKPIGGEIIPYWADSILEASSNGVVKVIKPPT